MLLNIFTLIILQPILNLLVAIYNTIPGNDLGLAIIVLTIIMKLILWPFTAAQIRQQRSMQSLQPKMDEIRSRLKHDKDTQAKELMDLYKREKVNPASSCLPLLIQLPIFIGLYQALRDGLNSKGLNLLYTFVANPGTLNPQFLGLIDLSQPNIPLAILAGAVQFWQSWQMMKKTNPKPALAVTEPKQEESMATSMNKQMMYIMPLLTVFIGFSLPGGLTLYWLVMSLLTVAQQYWFFRPASTKLVVSS